MGLDPRRRQVVRRAGRREIVDGPSNPFRSSPPKAPRAAAAGTAMTAGGNAG